MADERKPVLCPWCGEEMVFRVNYHAQDEDEDLGRRCLGTYVCGRCGATSPQVDTWECSVEMDAYSAATDSPPNLPLTLPELFGLADDDAAWVVSENGRIWAMGAECAREWASEERCLFFARKPTNADIAAARAGEGEEA